MCTSWWIRAYTYETTIQEIKIPITSKSFHMLPLPLVSMRSILLTKTLSAQYSIVNIIGTMLHSKFLELNFIYIDSKSPFFPAPCLWQPAVYYLLLWVWLFQIHWASLVAQGNLPANAGVVGSIPGVGKIPWKRKWQPTPAFLPGKYHGQRSLAGYSPQDCKRGQTRLVD